MTGKIGRKKVLKFRDFPARYHDDVFFVERGPVKLSNAESRRLEFFCFLRFAGFINNYKNEL